MAEDAKSHPDTGRKVFSYFVDQAKYESEGSSITGAQIKAMIPNFDRSYSLFLEVPGEGEDQLITDDSSVDLSKTPAHLYLVPPATFGE
jgi:hypothetical protein